MAEILEAERTRKEREARETRERIDSWLAWAVEAARLVLRRALDGDAEALALSGRIPSKIEFFRPAGPASGNAAVEPRHVEASRLGQTAREAGAPPSGESPPGGEAITGGNAS